MAWPKPNKLVGTKRAGQVSAVAKVVVGLAARVKVEAVLKCLVADLR